MNNNLFVELFVKCNLLKQIITDVIILKPKVRNIENVEEEKVREFESDSTMA